LLAAVHVCGSSAELFEHVELESGRVDGVTVHSDLAAAEVDREWSDGHDEGRLGIPERADLTGSAQERLASCRELVAVHTGAHDIIRTSTQRADPSDGVTILHETDDVRVRHGARGREHCAAVRVAELQIDHHDVGRERSCELQCRRRICAPHDGETASS